MLSRTEVRPWTPSTASAKAIRPRAARNLQRSDKYLKTHLVRSAIFWTAFPGRSAANIRNAMAVRDESGRYLDQESKKWSFDRLTKVQLREKLTAHLCAAPPSDPSPRR